MSSDIRSRLDFVCKSPAHCHAAWQVVLKLPTPWTDGTTCLVRSLLELASWLAALDPRVRLPSTTPILTRAA